MVNGNVEALDKLRVIQFDDLSLKLSFGLLKRSVYEKYVYVFVRVDIIYI